MKKLIPTNFNWILWTIILVAILSMGFVVLTMVLGIQWANIINLDSERYIAVIIFILYFILMYGDSVLSSDNSKIESDITPDINPTKNQRGKFTINADTEDGLLSFLPPGLFMGLIFLGIFGIILTQSDQDDSPVFIVLILLVTGVLGGSLIIAAVQQILINFRLGPGELELSEWPLKLGQEVKATYKREIFGQLNITDISPRLYCVTSAYIKRKNSNDTEKKKILMYEDDISAFSLGGPHQGNYEQDFSFNIPKYSIPSFNSDNHHYKWYLEIDLEIDNFPDDSSKFKLHVLPEIDTNE